MHFFVPQEYLQDAVSVLSKYEYSSINVDVYFDKNVRENKNIEFLLDGCCKIDGQIYLMFSREEQYEYDGYTICNGFCVWLMLVEQNNN